MEKGKKESLKSVYNLLKWTDTFQNENLRAIENILKKYNDKVIWFSSKKDVQHFLNENYNI